MKTITSIIAFAMAILFMSFVEPNEATTIKNSAVVTAEQNNAFTFLRTHRQGKGVTANWGMSNANDVVTFTIQRTYEDPTDTYAFWEELSVITPQDQRSFTYNDAEVFPGIIHYRIIALLEDGTTINSEISAIRIRSRH